jgi:hypothetical protein
MFRRFTPWGFVRLGRLCIPQLTASAFFCKEKNMKKVLVAILCMTVCGAALFAQTEAGFETKPAGGGVVITLYKGPGGAVVIPASIGGKVIVGIGDSAFYDCESLVSVTLPDSVTINGKEAFYSCDSLASVTLPTGVAVIGDRAFYGSGLKSVTLPASVTSVGDYAFYGLDQETHPDIVKRFGPYPFHGFGR